MLSQQIPWTSEPCTRRLHDHKLLLPDNYQSSQIENPTAKQCRKRGLKNRFSRAGTLTRESIQPLLCAWSIRGRFEISNRSVSVPSLIFFLKESTCLFHFLRSLQAGSRVLDFFFIFIFFCCCCNDKLSLLGLLVFSSSMVLPGRCSTFDFPFYNMYAMC